jgi:hypothetical protein
MLVLDELNLLSNGYRMIISKVAKQPVRETDYSSPWGVQLNKTWS